MIKANEIRVGNWILNGNNHYVQIGYHEIRYATLNPGTQNNYSPIPLTPEILEKCGFVGGEKRVGLTGIYIKEYSTVMQGVFKGKYQVILLETVPHLLKKPIQFVHELQNLFFCLTGEELDVKL